MMISARLWLAAMVLSVCCLVSSAVSAQHAVPPVGTPATQFARQALIQWMLCSLEIQGQQHTQCIARAQKEMVGVYDEARRSLMTQGVPLAMLKDLYAAWIVSMEGLAPQYRESEHAYRARTQGLYSRLQEMEQRFMLELE